MNKILLVGLLIFNLTYFESFAQTEFVWTGGNDNNDWFAPANWDINEVPDDLFDNVTIPSTGLDPVIESGSQLHIGRLTISAGANINNNASLTVNNRQLVVHGSVIIESLSGNTSATTGRVAQFVINSNSLVIVYNDLIFNVGVSGKPQRAVLNMSGGNGTFRLGTTLHAVDGSNNPSGTIQSSLTSTFQFNGQNQSIPITATTTYNNIVLQNTGTPARTRVQYGNITPTNVTGDITVQTGTFSDNGFSVEGNVGKNFTVNSGGIARFTSSTSLTGVPAGFTNNFATGSTVYLEGATQNLAASTFDNLVIAGTGDKTLGGNVTVNTSLNLAANNIITGSNYIQVNNFSPTAVSTSVNSKVIGNLQRAVTTGQDYSFPVGVGGASRLAVINLATMNGFTHLTVNYNSSASHGSSSAPYGSPINSTTPGQQFIEEGDASFVDLVNTGIWEITPNDGGPISSGPHSGTGTYNLRLYGDFNGGSAYTVVKRSYPYDATTPWTTANGIIDNSNGSGDGLQGSAGNYYVSRTGMTNFSNFGIALSSTPLPVDLKSFHAKLVQDYVQLDWVTLTETKSSHFVIERSRDSHSFDSIGTVLSAGNSSERLEYDFADLTATDILAKVLYYRLKQVDVDGQSKTYPMVGVDVENIIRNSKIKIFPNPATVDVTVASYLKEDVQLDIYNPLGKIVDKKKISSGKTTVDTSNLEQGVYVFKFINGSTVINKKVIIK